MRTVFRWSATLLACGLAAAGQAWTIRDRLAHVAWASGLPQETESADRAAAPRVTIFPVRRQQTFDWVLQTEQMFTQRAVRVHHVVYENAPEGHPIRAASPYRWWLGLIAAIDHACTGIPVSHAVERAVVLGDPLLQALALLVGAILVGWWFGALACVCFATGWTMLLPLASLYGPGAPTEQALAVAVLALARLAMLGAAGGGARARRGFLLAGVLDGLALWTSVSATIPALVGVAAGGAMLASLPPPDAATDNTRAAWRCWGLGGAAVVLAAGLLEYAPQPFGNSWLDWVHPLHGLVWLAVSEGLSRFGGPPGCRNAAVRRWIALATGTAALASLAVVPPTGATADAPALPVKKAALELWAWLAHDGSSLVGWATLLPAALVLVVVFAAAGPLRRRIDPSLLLGLAPAFGAALAGAWNLFAAAFLALVAALVSRGAATRERVGWALLFAATLTPSVWLRVTSVRGAGLSSDEAQLLLDRDLAQWLASRATAAESIVYAPPQTTSMLIYYGAFRGLGTFAPENDAAVLTTLRVASATSVQEAELLLESRGVRYLVLPAWDPFFDEYARSYAAENGAAWPEFLISALRDWRLPPWLRPLPYVPPIIGGRPAMPAQVFEIVPPQNAALAAARLTECLLALGETERAARSAAGLRRFPADVGALAAAAQVDFAGGETAAGIRRVALIESRLRTGGDRHLPWDRRVSLAIVLARAGRTELARVQVSRCLAEFDPANAAPVSSPSLHNLLILARAFGLDFARPAQRAAVLRLLTPNLRAQW